MNATDILTQFYNACDEEGRLLTRYGHVEFATTVRYVEKYLQPGMRILEIGAGTGRYSPAFTQAGYTVDAVELVQHNIDQFRASLSRRRPSPSARATPATCPPLPTTPTT